MRTANLALVIGLLAALALPLAAQQPANKEQEAKLIAVLKSDAPQKEKADACRELRRIGTADAVPALAPLLADQMLSHMARYGLETIPAPAADDALREALASLRGRQLAGVIGSLGVRKDAKAVPALGKLLSDQDPDVAQAAARSLGRIATPAAVTALREFVSSAPPENQLAVCEGMFRCAETLLGAGQAEQAASIYDQLRELNSRLHQVRAGALRGAILARQTKGIPILVQALQQDDFLLVDAAARTALEMPGPEVTAALTGLLGQGSTDKQILILLTLGRLADPAAAPAIASSAKAGDKTVRLAATRALSELRDGAGLIALSELVRDSDRQLAQSAMEGLAAIQGSAADALVQKFLESPDSESRVIGLDLVARKRMTSALPAVFKAASEQEPAVRNAALRRIGELAGPEDLGSVLALLNAAKAQQDLDALEQTLTVISSRAENPDTATDKLVGPLASAAPLQKAALLRTLGNIGGANALKAVRAAVGDPDAAVRTAAIRALGNWKTADAAPALLALAQSSTDPREKQLCLRSYLGLASQAELPVRDRLTMCREASALVQQPQEKKLLLSALSNINSPEALTLVTPALDQESTREEAASACVTIAERLLKGRNAARVAPRLIDPLQKVTESAASDQLKQRAKNLLEQAKAQK